MPCLENISILPYEKCNMRRVAVTRLCRNMSPFLVFPGTLRFANHRNMAPKIRLWIGQFCTSVTISLNISGTTHITRRYRIVLISFTLKHSILGKKVEDCIQKFNYSVTETTSKGGSRTGASGARPADWIYLGGGVM